MKLSIIIPTLNESIFLPGILADLKAQTFQDFEVIVSDANSKDNTAEIARKFKAKVVEGGLPGIGRNNGAKAASTDLFLFLDADVRIKNSDFLELCVKEFTKRNLDIAGAYFTVLHRNPLVVQNNLGTNWGKLLRQKTKTPTISGDFMMMKRVVFDEMNGFKDIQIGEDNDFVARAKNHGFKYGILKIKYVSSPRRIVKLGILNLTIAFAIFSFMQVFKKEDNKTIQKLAEKFYGKVQGGTDYIKDSITSSKR